jgi:death-on-curing protein
MSPRFLRLDEALELHREQIELYGGSHGVRDMGLLNSALAVPAATFDGQYLHAALSEMAAAYLFHICSNHAFFDGNKRTALVSAIAFLGLNDVTLHAPPDDLLDLVHRLSNHKCTKAEIAVFFERHTKPA